MVDYYIYIKFCIICQASFLPNEDLEGEGDARIEWGFAIFIKTPMAATALRQSKARYLEVMLTLSFSCI